MLVYIVGGSEIEAGTRALVEREQLAYVLEVIECCRVGSYRHLKL